MNAHAALDATTERFEIVTDEARLLAVESAWTALWQATDGLIFQSHAWIATWWGTATQRDSRNLRIGLVWSGERLLAVVPLAISRRQGVRLLEWAANAYSDYEDMLVAPECPPAALKKLWAQLTSARNFDVVRLNRLLPDAKAHALFADPKAGVVGLRPDHRAESSYRVGGPWDSGAAWFDSQSKKARQNYRRGRKALEEMGEARFRLLPPEAPLGPVLERLAVLKRKWLQAREQDSDLFAAGTTTLAGLADVLARAGVLRVFVLECNGETIAISLNFVQRGTMMAFVTTYDPDYERASPGTLLMTDYIQWSFDAQLTLVDFLCGAEAFKQRFATQSATLATVVGARTTKGHLALLADRTRQAVRELRARRAARAETTAVPAG